MKKFLVATVVCLLAGFALFLLLNPNRPALVSANLAGQSAAPPSVAGGPEHKSASAEAGSNHPPSSAPVPKNETLAAKAGQYIPPADPPINLPPAMVLQNLRHVIHQYGEMFGGNPVGTNPEITAALTGNNPKQINFLAGQPDVRIEASGALVDSWGTPYFFHQLSATEMEIHSAGPDKIMWTSDDLVTR
jgi:hypothetical protein